MVVVPNILSLPSSLRPSLPPSLLPLSHLFSPPPHRTILLIPEFKHVQFCQKAKASILTRAANGDPPTREHSMPARAQNPWTILALTSHTIPATRGTFPTIPATRGTFPTMPATRGEGPRSSTSQTMRRLTIHSCRERRVLEGDWCRL